MRENLSEELKLNDVITLDDGSENKEDEVKENEEFKKEVEKELEDKLEVALEIGEDDTPKAEANDSLGKSLKIKQFVEKLVLDETDNSQVLTEDLEDEMFEKRHDCVSKVYNALADFANFLYYNDYDVNAELDLVCEEALIRIEDGAWL